MKRFFAVAIACVCIFCGCGNKQNESSNVGVTVTEDNNKDSLEDTQETKEDTQEPIEETDLPVSRPEATEKVDKPEANTEAAENALYCTVDIYCDVLLDNLGLLDEPKRELVPENGVIFSGEQAFEEGDTVFDVLRSVADENGIQMEYVSVPAYDSYYIEGINNIYEMDAGPTSGWTYTVNGEYPSFGVNKYVLENGDKVVFDYILSY